MECSFLTRSSWLAQTGLLYDAGPPSSGSSTVSIACVGLTQTYQLTLLSVFFLFVLDSVNSPMSIYRNIYMYMCVQIQVLL